MQTILVPESFETYQLVEPNDIIIRCTDLQNDQTSLRTGLAKDVGIITSAYLNLNVKQGFDSKYLHYYLHALDTTKVIYKFGSGLRQNLSYLDFKRLPVLDIPLSEQQKISSFLDQKTSEIDQAISLKEQQITLLNERKQIVIQKAVIQGLNPNVEMTDSGVEWVAQIPKKWKFRKLKFVLSEVNIRSETGNETLLSLSKYKGVIPKDTLAERAGGAASLVGYKKVFQNNLVINKMQAVNGLIAVSEIEGITSPDYSVYSTKDNLININYIAFLLNQPEYLLVDVHTQIFHRL